MTDAALLRKKALAYCARLRILVEKVGEGDERQISAMSDYVDSLGSDLEGYEEAFEDAAPLLEKSAHRGASREDLYRVFWAAIENSNLYGYTEITGPVMELERRDKEDDV